MRKADAEKRTIGFHDQQKCCVYIFIKPIRFTNPWRLLFGCHVVCAAGRFFGSFRTLPSTTEGSISWKIWGQPNHPCTRKKTGGLGHRGWPLTTKCSQHPTIFDPDHLGDIKISFLDHGEWKAMLFPTIRYTDCTVTTLKFCQIVMSRIEGYFGILDSLLLSNLHKESTTARAWSTFHGSHGCCVARPTLPT